MADCDFQCIKLHSIRQIGCIITHSLKMPTVTAGNGKVGEISYIRQDVRNSRKAIVIEACYTFFTVGNSAVVMRRLTCFMRRMRSGAMTITNTRCQIRSLA